jgi:hypothetical protein
MNKNKNKIPNGGFPPIKICVKNNKKEINKIFSFQSKTVSIKEILEKKNKENKVIENNETEDLDIVSSI